MSRLMSIGSFLARAAASLALAYVLFILWMAAGLVAVALFALALHGGLALARHGDRPLEDWPLLRHLLRRRL